MLGAQPRALNDVQACMHTEEYKGAGHVLHVDKSMKTRWWRLFELNTGIHNVITEGMTELNTGKLPPEAFDPFKSELDWKVAEWFIKEDVGQSAFNRFLQIPEACCPFIL